jgi:prevent-host-death family protein
MESMGVKELRQNLGRVLKRVESGETVMVGRHGKGIAELRPLETHLDRMVSAKLRARGVLGGGSGIVGPVKSVRNRTPQRPVSDLVIEDRR